MICVSNISCEYASWQKKNSPHIARLINNSWWLDGYCSAEGQSESHDWYLNPQPSDSESSIQTNKPWHFKFQVCFKFQVWLSLFLFIVPVSWLASLWMPAAARCAAAACPACAWWSRLSAPRGRPASRAASSRRQSWPRNLPSWRTSPSPAASLKSARQTLSS